MKGDLVMEDIEKKDKTENLNISKESNSDFE